jgi:hypothetical protein
MSDDKRRSRHAEEVAAVHLTPHTIFEAIHAIIQPDKTIAIPMGNATK